MQIEERRVNNILIVTPLETNLDANIAFDFREHMAQLIGAGNRLIILNLSQVSFLDSSGLGAIVTSFKILGKSGKLVLCGIRDTVMTVFNLTRMDKVFRIFVSEADALGALTKEQTCR